MVPVCSFCGADPVSVWFEGPDFRTAVRSAETVQATDAWLACSTCFSLVVAGDRDGLARRSLGRTRLDPGAPTLEQVRTDLEERFWAPRAAEA